MIHNRNEVIQKIGQDFLTTNIENDEFSYFQVLKIPRSGHYKLDLRFEKNNYSILIELKRNKKNNFSSDEKSQLFKYTELERLYRRSNRIIAILFNLKNQNIKVWKDGVELSDEKTINSIDYYISLYTKRRNDKNQVIDTTNLLNNHLHMLSIKEKLRSQFVGSLLIALNNGLSYDENLTNVELRNRIKNILNSKIDNDENKKIKTQLLIKILDDQDIREIKPTEFCRLLDKINRNLIPFINANTSQGEDLLNLFFTTFNKYVGKADKNQAFTPTHITDFMCEITKINENSRVLDPTCGSGAFLVQAMSKMLKKAGNDENKRIKIKKEQIFGIERSETPFGLATTNMLIHQDGKTNVILESCFNKKEWIKNKEINVVLMNPPFNGDKMPNDCPKTAKNIDATKGLYFVYEIANTVNNGYLATILPLQCAIGSDNVISSFKKKILEKHTLEAVFSLPDEIFYPGASANACIMLFQLGIPHNSEIPTFFGYFKNDGFIKKKNRGRVEKEEWEITKKEWLDLFFSKKQVPGLSVLKKVSAGHEWLAEAYMETDYSKLKESDFVQTIRDFIAFKVKNEGIKND